ncbi:MULTISPECIES: APC family permease [unclassified Microbacterium]|uniref:APC family permease n=1 Tax=unclassified Microbacterium TaxID=2609290 RepID=UPI0012FCC165|nr:amino acid permease [Microbacterium sp. MAH-37]MVQ43764.1 amino acid permease [Microbacterium sp. MAH-37]
MSSTRRIKTVEQSIAETHDEKRSLKRALNTWDLAVMGVAVAVGAGIFSVGAEASAHHAGPAVIVSFVIAAVVCGLAILCYAEFASSIPVAGSAYTFTYSTLGEFLAWIIGWDLILEMLMAAAVIAKYWGVYLGDTVSLFDLDIPMTVPIGSLQFEWGPVVIVAIFTLLLALGTRLSSRVNAVFTTIKVAIVLFVIVVGLFFINPANFTPFVPPAQPGPAADSAWTQSFFSLLTGASPQVYGIFGILSGAALVFFAFIGFDVVATSAEEAKDPKRTVPRGILLGLGIVTVLYVLVAITITGMVSYTELAALEEPSLASAFEIVGATWAAKIISIGSLVGLTTVVMVLLLGLARIVFAMSRDGLLPRSLSVTDAKRGTPIRIQIIVGVIIAIIAGFTNVQVLGDMINIGTLSAFVLVSVGVPILRKSRPDLQRPFTVPLSPWLPWISAIACFWLMLNLSTETWLRFVIWLAIGFVIYFGYSRRHSLLGQQLEADAVTGNRTIGDQRF